jgi:hypothetical protein
MLSKSSKWPKFYESARWPYARISAKNAYCRIKRECIATAFTTTDPGINNAELRRFTTTEALISGGLNNAGRGRVAALSMQQGRKAKGGRQQRQERLPRDANETEKVFRQERQAGRAQCRGRGQKKHAQNFFLETPCKTRKTLPLRPFTTTDERH